MHLRKCIKVAIVVLLMIMSAGAIGQTQTRGFNYQAVARSASGDLLKETEITVKLSILDQSENAVWVESHTLTTNTQGLFTIPVGTNPEAVTSQEVENLAGLKWNDEAYSLNIEVNGDDLGLNPILAVPMAFYGRDEDADPGNEIQDLSFSNGNLTITKNGAATSVDLGQFVTEQSGWQKDANNAFLSDGALGVGTDTPEGVLDVVGNTPGDDPIFQVKNNEGVPVLAVYNEGVQILFPEDVVNDSKGAKGGFAIGGYNASKYTETTKFLEVLPKGSDIRFFADNAEKDGSKGVKGGFAIGGYNSSKDEEISFLYFDPYTVPLSSGGGGIIILPIYNAFWEKGNCYVGTMAGQNREGHFNTSVGYQSGYSIDAINSYPSLFGNTASYNTNLGALSGFSNITGDINTYVGYSAGYNNTGSGNVFIGYDAGSELTNTSDQLYIENSNSTSPLIWGNFDSDHVRLNAVVGIGTYSSSSYGLRVNGGTSGTYSMYVYKGIYATGSIYQNSDARIKKDIVPFKNGLEILKKLNGVKYNYRQDLEKEYGLSEQPQIGVIAQDVEKVLPELVCEDDEGIKGVAYDKLTVVLIEAVKEQQVLIEQQQQEIEALKAASPVTAEDMNDAMKKMESTIETLTRRIESMEKFAEK